MRATPALVMSLTAVVALAGCFTAPNHPTIEIEMTREGGDVVVTGTTDLPDGAVVEVAAWPGCPGADAPVQSVDRRDLTVSEGAFKVSLRPGGDHGTPMSVRVVFVPGDSTAADYGEYGEKMAGDGVFEDVGLHLYGVSICG